MRRYELRDAQWALIADLFGSQRTGRPRKSDDRQMLNAVLWVLCWGAAWRDLPARYGPWQTAYHRFRQWRQNGLFAQVLARLRLKLDECGYLDLATWYVDATQLHAAKAAAGAGQKGGRAKRRTTPSGVSRKNDSRCAA